MSTLPNHAPKGTKSYRGRGRPFAKGHSGQWPRPADADTRYLICPKCQQPKLLRDFLKKSNHKNANCNVCTSAIIAQRFISRINKIRSDPKLIMDTLNRLDYLQAEEAKTLLIPHGNILIWSRHLRKWNHLRSIWRTKLGLKDKKGLSHYMESMVKYGHWTQEEAEEWQRGYYERHPDEKPPA